VKLKAPNGTNVTVKGKQGFDSVTTGSVSEHFMLKPLDNKLTQIFRSRESTPSSLMVGKFLLHHPPESKTLSSLS
jgi:voltage-dependent anion channel protein 2